MNNPDYRGAPHGIWTDASGLTVQNLTIRDFYQHGIVLNPGAESLTFQNIRILDTGKQLIKANPSGFGDGVDGGLVENSVFAYTEGPPMIDRGGGTGYTNGVDVHAGANWVIRNNHFENFHAPDHADHLWAPVVLMWNGARDTVVENNRFVNVDRAIAFGLLDRAMDHSGGVIRNNRVDYAEGLYSIQRRRGSDGAIIVWSSPGTIVEGNEVFTRGNLNRSIEFRFDTSGASAINNTVDAPIGTRDGGSYEGSGNRLIRE
ncbi:right-handed parallel beta-helix repeat-containing protein [Marinobacter sp. DSM 26671]|uniref:right-handed parallel beta-helix repeat-containing protein n=1 Tax=Marinobacter sp. DSM 26671 TaxID=1761793 RepID=UPI001587C8E2|nr:right-handed parallel beta-helix repeat-containing protein [Marinobacter sp. DSM 26671]